jgi:hypothetical protein
MRVSSAVSLPSLASLLVVSVMFAAACGSSGGGDGSGTGGGTGGGGGGGDGGGGGGGKCTSLCTDAKFTSGTQTDFGGGLVECLCAGAGTGVAKAACETYCVAFKVSADNALLGMDNIANDKCACDGTTK